ncbi:hypothetical protein WICPIJ_007751 [Wickerhamomyces pijperi]|uniref:Actin cytoskeleton-regulatory complex protein SLA1 n=1 Tax=Wickerhamomyces pijperi TaxID=599730 RepID=A0A9P8TJU0_WICPI|nr:hypothetical protein WICPIJ_007751 [Wickerhamomyces pijperi]
MSFIGVYKALYDYAPQTDEELTISEGDLLYLIAKSDIDDWWTVKKRSLSSEDEPTGLVPSNYIETADVLKSGVALYDYEKQTEEEVTFSEGTIFDVYDDRDQDWILVGINGKEQYGFVPANYLEIRDGSAVTAAAAPVPVVTATPSIPSGILPPPQHPSLAAGPSTTSTSNINAPAESSRNTYSEPEEDSHSYAQSEEEEDLPPPKPTRPTASAPAASSSNGYSSSASVSASRQQEPDDGGDDNLYTWQVSEVDGRKKKKAMLAIGNNTLFFSPDQGNGTPKQWAIKDIITYSQEKKHLFIEFKNPLFSLELHCGSKDTASEILNVLGEVKGAVSMKGLSEIKRAASSAGNSKSNKKQGRVLFDFIAESSNELTVHENDIVNIINDSKSKDWWLVQNSITGSKGIVPSQFVRITNEGSSSPQKKSGGFFNSLGGSRSSEKIKEKKMLKAQATGNGGKSSSSSARIRDSNGESSSNKPPSSSGSNASGPNQNRLRNWKDRSNSYEVSAEFLGVVEGRIHLFKSNGVKIAVEAAKLSLADLEYVERVTGMSLDNYKGTNKESESERRERKEKERKRRERDEREKSRLAKERDERNREKFEREQDRIDREQDREERERLRRELEEAKRKLAEEKPPAQPPRPNTAPEPVAKNTPKKSIKESYDWFEFFLESGVDVNQCQRYSTNFQREQIDPEILESLDSSVLRTLGLREGDIIRVMKHLDMKFNRQPAASNVTGGLFTDESGKLKVNRTGAPTTDDDAWTIKPAVTGSALPTVAPVSTEKPVQQQFTGSMQDLLDLQPLKSTSTNNSSAVPTQAALEPTKTASAPVSAPTPAPAPVPTQPPAIPPQPTSGTLAALMNPSFTGGTALTAMPTGLVPLDPFKTGGANLMPVLTGGFVYMPLQKTGGVLNPALTGGLVPLQKTGGALTPAFTGSLVPLQKTGGQLQMPPTSFGANPSLTMPATSFGIGAVNPALTGGLMPQFAQQQRTGGFMPQTSFGSAPQITGSLPQPSFGANTGIVPSQITGSIPQTSFGFNSVQQPQTPGFIPQSTFGQQLQFQNQMATGFNNNNVGFGFGNQQLQVPQLGAQATGFNQQQQTQFPQFGQQMNQLTNQFQNTTLIGQQPTFGQPQQSQFGPNLFTQPQQQPQFNGFNTFQTQQQQQPVSFGFGNQQQMPLESQPTGFGFGNSGNPGNSQNSNSANGLQRANLANASAENPFGF